VKESKTPWPARPATTIHTLGYPGDRCLHGGAVGDEAVVRVRHETMTAVSGQSGHPVLQRRPAGHGVLRRGHHGEWSIETLIRPRLGQRRRQCGEFLSQAAIVASGDIVGVDHSRYAKPRQRREHTRDATENVVEARIGRPSNASAGVRRAGPFLRALRDNGRPDVSPYRDSLWRRPVIKISMSGRRRGLIKLFEDVKFTGAR
jgi:hypothetical protein